MVPPGEFSGALPPDRVTPVGAKPLESASRIPSCAEAYDIGHAVAIHVGKGARIKVLTAPSAHRSAKFAIPETGEAKCPSPVASDTITLSPPKPTISAMPSPFTSASSRGVLILAGPAAGIDCEVLRFPTTGEAKCPSPVASETDHPVAAEADDIGHAVAVHVGEQPRILILAGPAAGVDCEVRDSGDRRCEMSAAGGQRNHHPAAAEADDVGHAVAVHVGQLPRIAVLAGPAAGIDRVEVRIPATAMRSVRRRWPAKRAPRRCRSRRCRPCRRRSRRPVAADTVLAGPAAGADCAVRNSGDRRCELSAAGGQRHQHPVAPKPTMSAMPSPFTSASWRG